MSVHVVVMGVSGSGKSTVGAAAAARLGLEFVDADDLHPASNREKMRAGIALTDLDRAPWLALVGGRLAASGEDGVVVACSALRRAYRDALRARDPRIVFVHLTGPREVLAARLGVRVHEFMSPTLLDSQLSTLEPLGADENGFEVEITDTVADVVDAIVAGLA